MKKHITILLILISSYTYSQNNLYKPIQKEAYNSYVRIDYLENIINVWQNKDDSYSGEVIKYKYWYSKKIWGTQRDTIIIDYPISSANSQKIINLTKELRIDTISNNDDTWLPYKCTFLLHDSIIEKQFNDPRYESSTNELVIIKNYHDSISNIIDLPLITYDFKKHLPKYGNIGSTGEFSYEISGYTYIGYNYMSNAPMGFQIWKNFEGTKNIKIATAIGTTYNKSPTYSDVSLNISKSFTLDKKPKYIGIQGGYRNRYFINENKRFIHYNVCANLYRLRAGVISKNNDVGVDLGYSFYIPYKISKMNINLFAESAIYKQDFDYTAGITSFFKKFYTRIYYESFENKNFINFSIATSLKI